MKSLKLLISVITIVFPLIVSAQTVKLTTMNWSPFYAESLNNGGFITAIVEEALSEAGYDSTVEFTGWQTALDTVKSGSKDALIGAYYTEERTKDYYYSIPIYTVLVGLIKTSDFPLKNYNSFNAINEYKIGKIEGSSIGASFDAFDFSQLHEFDSVSSAVKALTMGEIDLYADNLAVAKDAAQSSGLDGSQLQILLPPLEENNLYLLISKSIPNAEELRDAFNKGLFAIQASGRFNEILAEYNQQ
ncbi:substrate-binding periplasmic protein [Marinomonas posidonica]|uniref:ABC-type transporter, periplasmic subunit family 3 n=1 Tax=Marinomonas posidonica (strain CECT 7376 / NCIMB 14433 / IVIA-Po-181) TaxID=491952 RepID=F6CTA6_MARPP|nr:transporter substrate-binding domain-containing protein [Marinomonas posidonica]AEF56272.1 ABC-type transporter, periplasmic subunit family 3 [Marinomonas posidonica IVIA-Po-181]